MICLASLRQWVGDGDGSKPGMSECQRSVLPDFCLASSPAAPNAYKRQERFEHSDAEPPAKFFKQARFLFLPLFVCFLNRMSPRVSKDVPRSGKWFPSQGNGEDFATKSLKKKKPTQPLMISSHHISRNHWSKAHRRVVLSLVITHTGCGQGQKLAEVLLSGSREERECSWRRKDCVKPRLRQAPSGIGSWCPW